MKTTSVLLFVLSSLAGVETVCGQTRTVFHVRLTGPLEIGHSQLVERALTAADREPGSLIVFEFHSAGGRLDLAQLIAGDLQASEHTTLAFINTQAWSAATLVALATDSIFMNDHSTIGGGDTVATALRDLPRPAMQAMRTQFGLLVENRGADQQLGEAMVDEGLRIGGLVDTGKLLTLTADEAVATGIAAGHVSNLDGIMVALGLPNAEIVAVGSEWTGTTVEVQNFNVQDARVFVVRGASRFRLGTVTSMGSSTFEVPGRFLPDGATIRMGIELIGSSQRVETERIRVQPGLVIQWVIENNLRQSSFSFYIR